MSCQKHPIQRSRTGGLYAVASFDTVFYSVYALCSMLSHMYSALKLEPFPSDRAPTPTRGGITNILGLAKQYTMPIDVQIPAPSSKPLPPNQRAAPQHPPQHIPAIQPAQDRNRPPLPLPIPVQRYRHGPEPRADQPADQPARGLVQGRREAGEGGPGGGVDAAHVEERQQREHGEVARAEERVRGVAEEGGAEEDQARVEEGRDEQGEEEREEGALFLFGHWG